MLCFDFIKKMLANCTFQEFGRSCNMLWFSFAKNGIEYLIHLQCFLRVLYNNTIIATSDGIYESYNNRENFEWDEFGTSRYDCLVEKYFRPKGIITSVTINSKGDLCLCFSDHYKLEVLNNSSQKNEIWRIIERRENSTRHFVYPDEFSTN